MEARFDHVRASRLTGDGKHLAQEQSGECPSKDKYLFQCPCESVSLAEEVIQSRPPAPSLFLTLPRLLSNLLTEMHTTFDLEHGIAIAENEFFKSIIGMGHQKLELSMTRKTDDVFQSRSYLERAATLLTYNRL